MISHSELKKGQLVTMDGQPFEVIEANPQRCAQRQLMIQAKFKNLITGLVSEKTVHQGDNFEEADMEKVDVKFLFSHKGKFGFCEAENPAARFELTETQVGSSIKFLKPNQSLTGIKFDGKILNIVLPIKVQLKVTEADPGLRGNRSQSGTKLVTVETGAQINVPLFVEQEDVVEINTDTGEYVRRVEKE